MGENVTTSSPSINDERRPLLESSSRRASTISRPYTHSRSASYGTYLPQFNSLDLGYLNRLLPSPETESPPTSNKNSRKEESREFERRFYSSRQEAGSPGKEEESTAELSPGETSPLLPSSSSTPSVTSPAKKKNTKEDKKIFKGGHSHKDSLIETESLFTDVYFLREVEQQLLALYDYTSFHLDSIKTSIDQFKENASNLTTSRHHQVLPPSNQDSFVVINAEGMEDKASLLSVSGDNYSDSSSIGGDSGIEDDHLTTPRGFFTRVREVVESLRITLETTVQQLDEMVGLYDERTNGNIGRSTLSRHNSRRDSLQEQIAFSLRRIDNELDDLRKKETEDAQIFLIQQKASQEGLGCTALMAFLLLLTTICFMSYLGGAHPTDVWIIVLRLLRSPLTIVLFMFLLGFNVMVWARFRIDYIRIFDFPISAIPTPKILFNMATMFTILFSSLSVICFISDWFKILAITDKTVALVMWIALLLFLFNPLKMFYRTGRFSFILVIVKVLIAPLPVVKFGDFWFADQLNSMVPLLLDFYYTLCYCSVRVGQSWTRNGDGLPLKTCTDSHTGIRPIISCLPALWRFLQCIRCYQKTKKIAHLINAVKYFTTFPVVIFSLIFALKVKSANLSFKQLEANIDRYGWIVIMWFISSLIHALYTFFWDIKMDWGLFCFSQRTILRPRLFYPKWIYFVAIVFDFIVRFACAIKLTLAIVYHNDSDIIYFGLIIAEVLRRWVWNFFRIEYEEILRSSKS